MLTLRYLYTIIDLSNKELIMNNWIWGKVVPKQHEYSQEAIAKFTGVVDQARVSFKQQFEKDLKQNNEIHEGSSFGNDDALLWVLESNVDEKTFMNKTEEIMKSVLLGAVKNDYYNIFEREF